MVSEVSIVIPLVYSCQLPLKKKKKMALPLLRIPGNCCIPFTRPQSFHSKSLRKTTVAVTGVQTPVGVAGGSDFQFPSGDVPSHKITVHDRQRGVVHEFLVPEVSSQFTSLDFHRRLQPHTTINFNFSYSLFFHHQVHAHYYC